jgi:hypothetical protein
LARNNPSAQPPIAAAVWPRRAIGAAGMPDASPRLSCWASSSCRSCGGPIPIWWAQQIRHCS